MALTHGAALDYLQGRFGGFLREVSATPSIGTSVAVAAPSDPERLQLTFMNLSANIIYLHPRSSVSATNGLILPVGGFLSMDVINDGLFPTLQWYALASGAASVLYYLGVRREVGAAAQ